MTLARGLSPGSRKRRAVAPACVRSNSRAPAGWSVDRTPIRLEGAKALGGPWLLSGTRPVCASRKRGPTTRDLISHCGVTSARLFGVPRVDRRGRRRAALIGRLQVRRNAPPVPVHACLWGSLKGRDVGRTMRDARACRRARWSPKGFNTCSFFREKSGAAGED